jgi:hypothetical protein
MPVELVHKMVTKDDLLPGDRIDNLEGVFSHWDDDNVVIRPTMTYYDGSNKIISVWRYEDTGYELPDPEYRASKFEDELCERLYTLTLQGSYNESLGSTEDIGWHCWMKVDLDLILETRMAYFNQAFSPVFRRLPDYAIIYEDDRGFVGYNLFWQEDAFQHAWKEIEQAYREFYSCQLCGGKGWFTKRIPNGTAENPHATYEEGFTCTDCEGTGAVYE